jgi:F-type H+-transporting ATPase subunit a
MLPFNVIGEVSRTIALAIRLYGNVMSGTLIVGILLSLVPLFFPIVMNVLGLITGVIQAYIFAILAMVYIAAATKTQEHEQAPESSRGAKEYSHPEPSSESH